MPKMSSINQYRKALYYYRTTDLNLSEICRLSEIQKNTIARWVPEWKKMCIFRKKEMANLLLHNGFDGNVEGFYHLLTHGGLDINKNTKTLQKIKLTSKKDRKNT